MVALTWSSAHEAATTVLAALLLVVIRTVLKLRDRVTRLEALNEHDERRYRS